MAHEDLVKRYRKWDKMSPIQKLADRLASGWKPKKTVLVITQGEEGETIEAEFNDFVLRADDTLELWHNEGYEI